MRNVTLWKCPEIIMRVAWKCWIFPPPWHPFSFSEHFSIPFPSNSLSASFWNILLSNPFLCDQNCWHKQLNFKFTFNIYNFLYIFPPRSCLYYPLQEISLSNIEQFVRTFYYYFITCVLLCFCVFCQLLAFSIITESSNLHSWSLFFPWDFCFWKWGDTYFSLPDYPFCYKPQAKLRKL